VKNVPPQTFKTAFKVLWVDTDAAQVVHFSNYFRFFERAEEEFYRYLGFNFGDFARKGLWFPRVEVFCQYEKPARFNDLVEVELIVEELREKSVRYSFRFSNKESEDLLAHGYMVAVVADKQTGKAVAIPADIVEKLKPFCK
jgi:YbgC/YbaW family acyl-CoA thioester hydrolase